MSQFAKFRALYSFTGLTPGEHSSGDKVYRGHISRQGSSRLRHMLVEASWKAIGKDKVLREFYERVAAKRGKKRAGGNGSVPLPCFNKIKLVLCENKSRSYFDNQKRQFLSLWRYRMGSYWSQPIRVESTDMVQLITFRTINSALWFVNNKLLEERILGFLAKYTNKYRVQLYGFCIVGSHIHLLVRFPKRNRIAFCRDFGARTAEAVRISVSQFIGGPLFERRYTPQFLPLPEDVSKYFFYLALQAVESGLTERISEYPGYNSFHDARCGIERKYKFFRYGAYNDAKRKNPAVSKKDFWEVHSLRFNKLPEYEHLEKRQYQLRLLARLEQGRAELVNKRKAEGKGFLGARALKKVVPGSLPTNPKKGGMRPIVLSVCRKAKQEVLNWYFSIVEQYKKASEKYRKGDLTVTFPLGTFRPSGSCFCPI